MITKIDKFDGEYRFLSNFYLAPIEYNGKIYPSSEHLYQAMKANDPVVAEEIRLSETPHKAKKLAKTIVAKSNWTTIKDEVMLMIVQLKFAQNPELATKLKATGHAELIEGNWWNDTYWGVCNGIGQNKLGLILQKVRDEL